MSGCLGELAAALVDGELDHDTRERAQAHLLHCPTCRADVESHRRLKARLSGLGGPSVPDALTARLLALPAPGSAVPPPGLVPGPPVRPRRVQHPRRHALRRRTAVASTFGLGVVAAALVLGGPQSATTPVDPGTDVFVVQHVDTTGEVPRVPVTTVGVTSR